MGLLDRLFSRKAVVSSENLLEQYLRGSTSAAGAAVTTVTAMRVAAVYSCVRVIAETIASLPLHMYRRLPNGKERVPEHPLYRLLHSDPNPWQTAFEFREMMQAHLCLRGNAYAIISWDGDRIVRELLPIHPDRVQVTQRADMSLVYDITGASGAAVSFPQEEILHVRGLSSDGIVGRSVLSDAREVIGVASATQDYASRLFANDATPGVIIKHPARLGPEASKNLKASWDAAFSGSANARRTAVLEEGMTIERLSMTADDSQFLETRKFTRSEISGIFRVPPHLIGDLDRATFSNIEHMGIDFVTHCIRPWLVRWEQALSKALIVAPQTYFPEFNVDALLRGDIKSRYEAYAVGRNWGWLSANDIRSLENLNPVDDGDEYLQPLNMVRAGTPPAPAEPPAAPPAGDTTDGS
jgi:HK97 family phage portal protein